MSDARTDNRFDNLRQAFAALEKSEVKSPHADAGPCLSLFRLRDLATDASITTSGDSRHLHKCRNCSVSLSAMQSELGTDPKTKFDSKLVEYTRTLLRFDIAEKHARELFDRIHVHREEPDRSFTWSHMHAPVQALRRHHSPGEHQDAESIVAMISAAIHSALADASTPFAQSLDAAWPIVMMMVTTGEAVRHNDHLAARFAGEYADIMRSVPVPLKAALAYGIGKFVQGGPQLERIGTGIVMRLAEHGDPTAHSILTMLSDTEVPALKLALATSAPTRVDPQLVTVNTWLNDLKQRLHLQGDLSAIVSTVQNKVCDMLASIFKDGDSTSQLLQLLLTRHYLSGAVSRINKRWPNTLDSFHYMGDIACVVMRNAQYANHQYFVASEVVSAIGSNLSAVRAMADLLETPDTEMRQALFVWRLELACGTSLAETADAISNFDNSAATMAKDDPEIAALVDWSWLHVETHVKKVNEQRAKA
jgi:hypothetical protein